MRYPSRTYGRERRAHVYLPAGYGRGDRYPVLYLLPGANADDSAWTSVGGAANIFDNLIADGRLRPMIVVMPNGDELRDPTRRPAPDASDAQKRADATEMRDAFLADLSGDLLPFVDRTFRTRPGEANRAIAGFSFGGAEALAAGTASPGAFGYVGVFSMGVQGGSKAPAGAIAGSGSDAAPDGFVRAHPAFFADPARTNARLKLFYIAVGRDDGIVADGPAQLDALLTRHGIRHRYVVTSGGHEIGNWQNYLGDFGAALFR